MLINFYARSAGSPPVTDPDFADVGLLLHFGALPFVDSSSNGLTVTTSGTSTLDTSDQLFGPGCAKFFSGSNSPALDAQFTIASAGPIDISSGDYTIEGFFYPLNPASGTNVLFLDSSFGELFVTHSGTSGTVTGTVNGATVPAAAGACPVSTWTHVALVMQSNAFTLYCGGVATGSPTSVSRGSIAGQTLYIGGSQFGVSFAGLVQDFRVTKGVARYTSNFTPPSAPFPNS